MSDNKSRNRSFINLAIVAGVILLGLLIGQFTGHYDLAIRILKALGLVMLGITILVTIHELGHFLTAKMFGMRVETFSIGFPPKLFSFTKGETEYMFGATPLGGFVKISGIIDESLDTNHLNEEPEPYEFRAKPVWQRLIVMTGGVIMNIILGVAIFWGFKFSFGDKYTPIAEASDGIFVQEYITVPDTAEGGILKVDTLETIGHYIGLRTGDQLVNLNGEAYPYVEDYQDIKNLISSGSYYTVLRDGQEVKIDVPGDLQNYLDGKEKVRSLFAPRADGTVKLYRKVARYTGLETVVDSLPAYQSGLQDGDLIVMLDSTPVKWYYTDIKPYISQHFINNNGPIAFHIERKGQPMVINIQPNPSGVVGIEPDYQHEFKDYSFFGAFGPGVKAAFGFLTANYQGLKNVVTNSDIDASKSVMGPIQIANQYLLAFEQGGVIAFLSLTANLSMILALVNILPIPALDGGHVVFLLIEAITRREPSPKVRIIAQQIGMIIILGLMILIFGNDIFQTIFN